MKQRLYICSKIVKLHLGCKIQGFQAIGSVIQEAVDGLDFLKKMRLLENQSKEPDGKAVVACDLDNEKGFNCYYLCIVDNIMPNFRGMDAVARLRSLGYEGLIVGLTGNGHDDDISAFKGHGADFVIVKPMKIQELVRIINLCSASNTIL